MERYSFFNAEIVDGQPDRDFSAEDFASYFASFIGTGVYANPVSNLQVTAAGNMALVVAMGKAWINGYCYENTEGMSVVLDLADGTLKRIDRIVVRLDLVARNVTLQVLKGVKSGTPQAPVLVRNNQTYDISLATILIKNGTSQLLPADITDTRFDSTVCGVVTGVVDQIDTTGLFSQYNNEFNTWFNIMKNQLGTDAAGNLQNQIGVLSGLKTAGKGSLTVAANELFDKDTNLQTQIGNLTTLKTTNKTSLVNAANELFDKDTSLQTQIGTISTLKTVTKTSTVDAVNELYTGQYHGGFHSAGDNGLWKWEKFNDGYCKLTAVSTTSFGVGTAFLGGYWHSLADVWNYPFAVYNASCIGSPNSGSLATFVGGSCAVNSVNFWIINGVSAASVGTNFGLWKIVVEGNWK